MLANESDTCHPIVENPVVKVYPSSLQNDGTALKPGLRFDERQKKVVGLTDDINVDCQYIDQHPTPSPDFIKEKLVTEALVTVQSSMDNAISMPIGVDYVPKRGKTGDNMQQKFKQHANLTQTCLSCLNSTEPGGASQVLDHILCHSDCDSFCNECWQNKELCVECTAIGHSSIYPQVRACRRCTTTGQQCIKSAVLIYICN
jgi:hypothetical protein